MAEYSPAFNLKIVNNYLKGILGYVSLPEKYQISDKKQIYSWVRKYKQNGKSGLEAKEKQELTAQFKLIDVLKVTHFPKSTNHYWIKKMKQKNLNKEIEELILTLLNENNENYGYH